MPDTALPTVSGRWLLKAVGAVIVLALLCSYISLALLYYQGQWQIVLHPDKAAHTQTPPPGLIHFGPDDSGRPQLTGEWLPAPTGSRYGSLTILFLSGGDGSRKDFKATIDAFHALNLNVFNFDYRGYGLSADVHPSQQRMTEDTESAWRYLTASRGIAAGMIIPYGTGVGASLATHLAAEHNEVRAVILDNPHTDLLAFARTDARSGLLPTSLLFHERFPLASTLSSLATPKLLIAKNDSRRTDAFKTAATPKIAVELPSADGPLFDQAVTRFLDQYFGQAAVF